MSKICDGFCSKMVDGKDFHQIIHNMVQKCNPRNPVAFPGPNKTVMTSYFSTKNILYLISNLKRECTKAFESFYLHLIPFFLIKRLRNSFKCFKLQQKYVYIFINNYEKLWLNTSLYEIYKNK